MEWQTTSTILQDLKTFDRQDAWERFVERFRRPIVSFVRDLGLSPSQAEDVAQETLLAFASEYQAGKYDREKGRLNRWLFGIAYRQALRQRRRNAVGEINIAAQTDDGQTFWRNLPDEVEAQTRWDQQWSQAILQMCLERVRCEFEPATIEAFEMVVIHEKDASAAAEALSVPIKSVYNAKHRVLKRIRELRETLEAVE